MKGIHPLKNGHWRVNIMVNRERMTKTCNTYDEALHVAAYIRSFLQLKHKGQRGHIMYTINKNGQIENEGQIVKSANDAAKHAHQAGGMIQTFTFPANGQGVRLIQKDGQPWFLAKDVCDCLGLTNGRQAVTALDEDEKSTVRISDGTSPQGGNPNKTIISESGLYALIFRSNKPEARVFSKWVRAEVLPAIRRTGGYIIANPEESPETLMARALFVAKDAIDRLNTQLEEAQPKVESYDALMDIEDVYTVTEAAKHFGMSAQRLNEFLREVKWVFTKVYTNTFRTPLPYQRIVDQGYIVVKSRVIASGRRFTQSYITPRGLIAIERLLRRRFDA